MRLSSIRSNSIPLATGIAIESIATASHTRACTGAITLCTPLSTLGSVGIVVRRSDLQRLSFREMLASGCLWPVVVSARLVRQPSG